MYVSGKLGKTKSRTYHEHSPLFRASSVTTSKKKKKKKKKKSHYLNLAVFAHLRYFSLGWSRLPRYRWCPRAPRRNGKNCGSKVTVYDTKMFILFFAGLVCKKLIETLKFLLKNTCFLRLKTCLFLLQMGLFWGENARILNKKSLTFSAIFMDSYYIYQRFQHINETDGSLDSSVGSFKQKELWLQAQLQ